MTAVRRGCGRGGSRTSGRRGAVALMVLVMLVVGTSSGRQAAPDGQEFEARLGRMRHTWGDEELSLEALAIDLDLDRRDQVSAEEAVEDVERLFDLLAHGWSGYGLFDEGGRFAAARARILEDLETRESWRVDELPGLVRSRLDFVRDCHTRIGGLSFGEHRDLWMASEPEFVQFEGTWHFEADGIDHSLVSVDGQAPDGRLLRSLSADGRLVYRLGVVSATPPEPLILATQSAVGTGTRELELQRSGFEHWSDEVFHEDRIGGIGVLRMRGFGDADPEAMRRWVASAERYRDAPCVVVDLRGNRGGNERWACDWIESLTGVRPSSSLVFSELESRTTMAGRLNAQLWWDRIAPGVEEIRKGLERHRNALARFGPEGEAPRWTGPLLPRNSTIPSDTTVVVVTNGLVASAGEGFVMRMRQAENVVVVGENTRGALTFGNVSLHQLPRSGLEVWLPINLNLSPDGVFREERGLEPDWWVPAGDALNHAIAALRSGTIPTVRPLPPEVLAEPFVPEDPWQRAHAARRRRLLLSGAAIVAAGLLARRMRRRPMAVLSLGLVWLVFGGIWLVLGRSRGPFITDAGVAFVVLGAAIVTATLLGRLLSVRSPRSDAPSGG